MAEMNKARNSFTAVSFKTLNAHPESAYEITVVSVKKGEIGTPETYNLLPLSGTTKSRPGAVSFREVFKKIEKRIADVDIPVVGWGAKGKEIFKVLVSEHDIEIDYPVRYFDLQASAAAKLQHLEDVKNWQAVAKRYKIPSKGEKEPSATACAQLQLAIEQNDFEVVVARAFLAFIKSIMDDDNQIDTYEAQGLQAFLSLITSSFEQFKELQADVDDALADGVVEKFESDRLMKRLGGMRERYQNFIDSREKERFENK